jgi:hypothetical protein
MRRHSGTLLPVLSGLALGFLGGFLLRGAVGGVDRRRLRTLREEITGEFPVERPLARAAVSAVAGALEREPSLAGIAFTVVPVGRGHVELHGWVPTRAIRARAFRVATGAAPAIEVTNRLSVHGEDDAEPAAETDALLPA